MQFLAKIKSWVKLLLWNLFFLVIGLSVIELIFGGWVNPKRQPLYYLNIPVNKHWGFPVKDLYPANYDTFIYTRDKYGLRGSYTNPAQIDIVTIGGSTTDQRYVGDEFTWQTHMQTCLSEKQGRIMHIANAGVDGQSSIGHLRNFSYWFPFIDNFRPKYMLYYIGLNELYNQQNQGFQKLVRSNNSVASAIQKKSVIYSFLHTLYGIWVAKNLKINHGKLNYKDVKWGKEETLTAADYAVFNDEVVLPYKQRLRELITLTQQLGAKPILVTQLSREYKITSDGVLGIYGKPSGVDIYRKRSLINQATIEICRDAKAICLDLAQDLQEEVSDEDFYDYGHNTPVGAKKIGLYMCNSLNSELN